VVDNYLCTVHFSQFHDALLVGASPQEIWERENKAKGNKLDPVENHVRTFYVEVQDPKKPQSLLRFELVSDLNAQITMNRFQIALTKPEDSTDVVETKSVFDDPSMILSAENWHQSDVRWVKIEDTRHKVQRRVYDLAIELKIDDNLSQFVQIQAGLIAQEAYKRNITLLKDWLVEE
jgi:hypothetical protein